MEDDLKKAKNLKLLFLAFEQLSGVKINFQKSELFCFGESQELATQYAELFGASKANSLLGIWELRYIIGDSPMLIGNMWMSAYRNG